VTLVAVLAAATAAATAFAGVVVYKNNFSRKSEVRELRRAEGKHCRKHWRERTEKLVVVAKRGPTTCGYEPPVEGDSAQPNHDFRAKEKLLKKTPKRIRRRAYLALKVRASKKAGYQLRVFPATQKWELRRAPSGGGPAFPASGKSNAVKGRGKTNNLRLKAQDDTVAGFVNGTKLTKVKDPSPNEVRGRRVEFAVGQRRHSNKPASAIIDALRLAVPNP
jgi:hypothetical protein